MLWKITFVFVIIDFCLFVSEQHNSKSYWWIFFKFSHIVYICLCKSWLNFGDANVTVAYFMAPLKFMGPLPGWRSALYEWNSLVLDATGVRDKDAVITLQSRILDCLRKYTIRKYPNDLRRYGKMLLRLPALRTVSAIAAERFLSISLDGSIKMNALVLEMMS